MSWWSELLRKYQDPLNDPFASEIITDAYVPYSVGPRPKIKTVITETDDDKPNVRKTTIDYPQGKQFIPGDSGHYGGGSLSASMPSAEVVSPEMRKKAALMALTSTPLPIPGVGLLASGLGRVVGNIPKIGGALSGAASKAGLWTPGFQGATRAGQMLFGRNARGEMVRRIAKERGDFSWPGRPTALGYTVAGAGSAAPFVAGQLEDNGYTYDYPALAGVADQGETYQGETYQPYDERVNSEAIAADKARVDSENAPPGRDLFTSPGKGATYSGQGKNLADVENKIASGEGEKNQDKNRFLQAMYGKYAQDPEARKQQYLDQLNKIYRNAMILNAVAQFTGGRSQADAYVRMATAKMDAIDKFDNEERMQGIWKDVFFNEKGEFSPPPDWQSTYEAVIKLGGTPKEAEELASSMFKKPSSTDKAPGGVTTEQYMLWKKMTSQAQTPEEKADAEAYGRMVGAIRDDRTKITPQTASNLITKIEWGEIPDNGMKDKLLKIINDALNKSTEIATPQQNEGGNKSLEAARKRIKELEQEGLNREQIKKQLKKEGFPVDG